MPLSRRFSSVSVLLPILLLSTIFPLSALASGSTIKLVSPAPGSSGGYPTYYEAYSYSTTCKAGISAMRIYSAPGVPALTVESSHIAAFIGLSNGTNNTTIVAWDNCGGSSALNVPITVNQNDGVTVFLPSSTTAAGPVHITASSQSSLCANGIDAMRIYTSPGVAPYSVFSNQVDAFLTLAPGTYNIVVQAWDNCGNVFKRSFQESVTTSPDRFLYSTGSAPPDYNTNLIVFSLSNGSIGKPSGLLTKTGTISTLQQILVDPSGYFLYATDGSSIFAYDIDRNDGSLQPAPGSPYKVENATGGNVIKLALDPNGHFLYVSDPIKQTMTVYTIYRSDGSLTTYTGDSVPGLGGYALLNYTGGLLFETSYDSGDSIQEVTEYEVDQTTGLLTQTVSYNVPDPPVSGFFPLATAWKYLYLPQRIGCCGEQTFAYEINSPDGLSGISGSPFVSSNDFAVIGNAVADWLTRYYWYPGTNGSSEPVIQTSIIDANTGQLGANSPTTTGNTLYEYLAEDHSGKYLYSAGQPDSTSSCPNDFECEDVFGSWTLGSEGRPIPLSSNVTSPYQTNFNGTIAIATSR